MSTSEGIKKFTGDIPTKDTSSNELSNLKNIVFQSALGQWDDGLSYLIEKLPDELKNISIITNWELNMFDNSNVFIHKTKKFLETISNYSTSDNLHIFVAPMTWAAKFSKMHKLKVIGPAFGTIDDLKVFARRDLLNGSGRTRIGVINHDITSAVLVKFFVALKEKTSYTLSKNIHNIIKGTIETVKDLHLESEYECPNFASPSERIEALYLEHSDEQKLDYAVFTQKEINDIEKDSSFSNILSKEIITLDRVLAHYFNLSIVPRSVFCIHDCQFLKYQELIESLFQQLSRAIKNINEKEKFNIRPIDFKNEHFRNVQNGMISYVKNNYTENADLYQIAFENF